MLYGSSWRLVQGVGDHIVTIHSRLLWYSVYARLLHCSDKSFSLQIQTQPEPLFKPLPSHPLDPTRIC